MHIDRVSLLLFCLVVVGETEMPLVFGITELSSANLYSFFLLVFKKFMQLLFKNYFVKKTL